MYKDPRQRDVRPDSPTSRLGVAVDPAPGVPAPNGVPPDPSMLAIEHRKAGEVSALRGAMHQRDLTDAKTYGVSLAVWQSADDKMRQIIINDWLQRTKGDAGRIESTINLGDLRENGGDTFDTENIWERAMRELREDPAEARQYTYLCRPIIQTKRWGRIHQPPGIIKIHNRMVARKLGQGFTYYPEADFAPERTVVCDLCIDAGVEEPFADYPAEGTGPRSRDMENHQRSRHPNEWDARNRLDEYQGKDDLRSAILQQGKVIEMLARTLVGPDGEPIRAGAPPTRPQLPESTE